MATAVTATPGGVSTTRQNTAEKPMSIDAIIGGHIGDQVSRDALFLWELTGGSGHGHVPREEPARAAYFKQVRKHLMKTYCLSGMELAHLIEIYREPNVGPHRATKRLRERIIQ